MRGTVARTFDRAALLAAFDRIGEVARDNGAFLEIAVYGGSALMLASRFRYATEDADIGSLPTPWPDWLRGVVCEIASRNDWDDDWLNDAVQVHLSPLADTAADHVEFGTFPSAGDPGLRVHVPVVDYMLALKLKAISRVNDPVRGPQETADVRNLIRAAGVTDIEGAIAVLARYFPRSALDADKHRFLLKHIWPTQTDDDPPRYPVPGR
jgi:hypothetical protein